jgi:hypothetical protein
VTLPVLFQVAIYCSPFSHMIWVHQDVLWYETPAHPRAWAAFTLRALGGSDPAWRVARTVS